MTRICSLLNHHSQPGLQWVEAASSFQIPSFHIVGLPSKEIHEARERVRAAIEASGMEFPRRRLVLNLSPASVRKQGTGIDLALALAVLESGTPTGRVESVAASGELGLDGALKPSGQLTRSIYAAWKGGVPFLLVPKPEANEARHKLELLRASRELPGEAPRVVPVGSLAEARDFLDGPERFHTEETDPDDASNRSRPGAPCELLPVAPAFERILAVAASGSHHLLLLGPRGSGKSHLLDWLVAIQPIPDARTQVSQALLAELHSSRFESVHGSGYARRIGPHARPASLLGSGSSHGLRPGEFTLAHGGLLIADEFPEWNRDSREALREPLERGWVTLTRAQGTVELPASFTFAANGNLCPCGGWPRHAELPRDGSGKELKLPRCRCRPSSRLAYLSRLSGPILDRIDLVAEVFGRATDRAAKAEPERLRERVLEARGRAIRAWGKPPGKLEPQELESLLAAHPTWSRELDRLESTSLRDRHKTLRLALSLSCLDTRGSPEPATSHFREALCYRPERLACFQMQDPEIID